MAAKAFTLIILFLAATQAAPMTPVKRSPEAIPHYIHSKIAGVSPAEIKRREYPGAYGQTVNQEVENEKRRGVCISLHSMIVR